MRAAKTKPIDIDKVINLTQEQAMSRYNVGKCNLRVLAEEIGAIVRIGAGNSRILYNRKKLDAYFENHAE